MWWKHRGESQGWVRTRDYGSTNQRADLNAACGGPQGECVARVIPLSPQFGATDWILLQRFALQNQVVRQVQM